VSVSGAQNHHAVASFQGAFGCAQLSTSCSTELNAVFLCWFRLYSLQVLYKPVTFMFLYSFLPRADDAFQTFFYDQYNFEVRLSLIFLNLLFTGLISTSRRVAFCAELAVQHFRVRGLPGFAAGRRCLLV
jgi:hypothetical protein